MATLSASAQTLSADSLSARFFEAKVNELAERLHFTDAQKAEFVPVYRRYTDEMIAACGGYQRPLHQKSSEEAAASLNEYLQLQQRALAVRQKYVGQFAAVLDAQQLSRLYSADNMLQRKIRATKAQAHSHSPRVPQHSHSRLNKRPAWQGQPPASKKLPVNINHNHGRGKTFKGVNIPAQPVQK